MRNRQNREQVDMYLENDVEIKEFSRDSEENEDIQFNDRTYDENLSSKGDREEEAFKKGTKGTRKKRSKSTNRDLWAKVYQSASVDPVKMRRHDI